ncbi:hypothetical protein V2J94_16300 [Streptomyces sp. DSM 41524]|uniref:Uncharacterized protein n=1 Tax=Streptomyces asiaticus subsp. ignotus TaxID=3098222 RepID=A0ABU7PWE3_9ACTN|nr:hypothetical protein [Streptomyces sp. DSM 41524]
MDLFVGEDGAPGWAGGDELFSCGGFVGLDLTDPAGDGCGAGTGVECRVVSGGEDLCDPPVEFRENDGFPDVDGERVVEGAAPGVLVRVAAAVGGGRG